MKVYETILQKGCHVLKLLMSLLTAKEQTCEISVTIKCVSSFLASLARAKLHKQDAARFIKKHTL